MKTRNYTARAHIMSKGGKFVTDTQRYKNRQSRKLAKQSLKRTSIDDRGSFFIVLKYFTGVTLGESLKWVLILGSYNFEILGIFGKSSRLVVYANKIFFYYFIIIKNNKILID